ncbi:MAG: TraR/DksA family transcriptional regulator [Bacteroidetes bacterium]|nr:MAG: TraR/DksA family transcriptional regulator [Bacteroidota bacterium]
METEEIKQNILDEITKTKALIAEYKEMTKPVAPDDAIGRISRMDAINNKSVTEASLRQAEEKLKNLQRVLSRVGTKEFGICIKCGKPIPAGRILYRPESLSCVDCAT